MVNPYMDHFPWLPSGQLWNMVHVRIFPTIFKSINSMRHPYVDHFPYHFPYIIIHPEGSHDGALCQQHLDCCLWIQGKIQVLERCLEEFAEKKKTAPKCSHDFFQLRGLILTIQGPYPYIGALSLSLSLHERQLIGSLGLHRKKKKQHFTTAVPRFLEQVQIHQNPSDVHGVSHGVSGHGAIVHPFAGKILNAPHPRVDPQGLVFR